MGWRKDRQAVLRACDAADRFCLNARERQTRSLLVQRESFMRVMSSVP